MANAVEENSMFIYSKRLETFKGWPFTAKSGCKCTAEKLAQSGFFRPKPKEEPELARCFMCHKDLEGWDETDEPETEHKSHSPKCPFLSVKNRDILTMKMRDYIKLKYTENCQLITHETEVAMKDLKKKMEKKIEEQVKMQNGKRVKHDV